ncbi:MAG: hypothetical protein IT372_22135 [Polyangiaceae bacterium]|nr:hypothetical protein [Polyangiaceae bacterium]
MKWDIEGTEYDRTRFGDLDPHEILYEFDGPRIFDTIGPAGDQFLAYLCDGDEAHNRYVVVPSGPELISGLRAGTIAVRDALNQPWTWLVDQTHDGEIDRVMKIDFRKMPEDVIPRKGALLWPSLRPLLSVRMVGQGLEAGHVPASVIRRAVDGATSALKTLAEWALHVTPSEGRPSDWLRRYYDLPAQRIAFASFEVAFAAPAPPPQGTLFPGEEQALDKMGGVIQAAISWAESHIESELPSEETSRVALEALSRLTPPKHGLVTEVHIGGRLVGASTQPRVLTRSASDRVQRALRKMNADVRPVKLTGKIREIDKDKLTLILRDEQGKDIARCIFPESLYDEALAAFDSDELTTVLGHESMSRGIVDLVSIGRESLIAGW